MKFRNQRTIAIMVTTLLGSVLPSLAEPIYFGGHYYDRVDVVINWTAARDQAAATSFLGLPGGLVAIESPEENSFIVDNLLGGDLPGAYWIGGYQEQGAPEPDGGWGWVTGEDWDYTNWDVDQPGNEVDNENAIQIEARQEYALGTWHDRRAAADNLGYIIEYVPEPASLSLLLLGGLAVLKRRR